MKISLRFAKALLALTEGQELNEGDFGGGNSKFLLEKFKDTGVLDYRPIGHQRKRYYCTDKVKLTDQLHQQFDIPSLEAYVNYLEQESKERSDAVRATSDSKFGSFNVLEGFLIHTYEEIEGVLNGKPVPLHPVGGSFVFIHDFRNFVLPAEVTVVGVENHENFKQIARQRYLFENIQPVFVWRYQNSNSLALWLNTISNAYVHFGDFDPAGLKIYVSQFRNKIGAHRCSFLIPDTIEMLIFRHGSKKLFEKQAGLVNKNELESCPELKELVHFLWRLKKGLEQEILITRMEIG